MHFYSILKNKYSVFLRGFPCKCCLVKICDDFYVSVLSLPGRAQPQPGSSASRWHQEKTGCSGLQAFLSPSESAQHGEILPATNAEGFWNPVPYVQSFTCSENKNSFPLPSPATQLSVEIMPWSSHHPILLLALSESCSLELKYWYTGKNSSPGQSQSFPPYPSFLCHSWMKSRRTKFFVLRIYWEFSTEHNLKVLPHLGVQSLAWCCQAWPLLDGGTCSGRAINIQM